MLARENGKEGTAEVLKEWLANEDQDLREREGDGGSGSGTERKPSSTGALDCLENTVRKRLYVKQSIDHALNSLKACCLAPAAEPASPLGECTFYAPSASRPNTTANNETSTRRPSLPHIYDDLPVPSPSSSRADPDRLGSILDSE